MTAKNKEIFIYKVFHVPLQSIFNQNGKIWLYAFQLYILSHVRTPQSLAYRRTGCFADNMKWKKSSMYEIIINSH